jgi:hypothetical protein
MMSLLSELGAFMSNFTLTNENFRPIMNREIKFDAAIVEIFWVEALYGIGSHLNIPVIGLSTFSTSKWTNDLAKVPMEFSYVPHNFVKFSDKMNFKERVINFLVGHYENIFMEFVHYERQRQIFSENFKKNSFDDQMKNVSLIFLNHHFSLSSIRPIVANMVTIK